MFFYHPPTNQGTIDALGCIYRSLRAWKFYPAGHPTRRNSITQAHSAMLALLDGNNLSLSCSRAGFSFPDGEKLKDVSHLTGSLAYELLIRRINKITFMQDLFLDDLLDLLKILILHPETIQKMGGVDKIMAEHGVRTIWVNEFDLSIISEQRRQVESRGIIPQSLDEAEEIEDAVLLEEEHAGDEEELPPGQQLQALLERLAAADDEDIYALLLRQAICCADALKTRDEIEAVFPLVELLARHAADDARRPSLREFDRFALEQLASGEVFFRFVFERVESHGSLSKNALQAVLHAGGPAAITLAAEQMGATNHQAARKALATHLANLGEPVVPVLLPLLSDKRWYFIRNLCVILGTVASADGIAGLTACLQHGDIRVRKEAVRSLAKIGGRDAESALIDVLRGNDQELYPQVMASLGGIRSKRSRTELLRILSAKDLFLTSLPLKLNALAAIAMIGDKQLTPYLVEMLMERRLLAPSRWKQLKVAIAQCLGKLEDTRALPALSAFASDQGDLGAACREAIDLIERSGGKPDGPS